MATNRERIISTVRLYIISCCDGVIPLKAALEEVDKELDRVWGLAVSGISLDEPIVEAAPYPFPMEPKNE